MLVLAAKDKVAVGRYCVQASRDDHHQLLQKHIQQLEQQMKEEQRSLQRQLESSSRKAATQAVGQLMVTKVVWLCAGSRAMWCIILCCFKLLGNPATA